MKKLLISVLAVTIMLTACGGGGGAQDDVADLFIEAAEGQGLGLDEGCVKDNTARLSDSDAEAIVEAGVDGDPQVSAEGDAIGDAIFERCVDLSSYIDLIVSSFAEDGDIDADCMREAFDGLTINEIDDNITDAAFACLAE